jgi:hypothetical protein
VFRVRFLDLLDELQSCLISPSRDTLQLPDLIVRRGSQAVDGTGLENRQGFTPLEGSNPSLSASQLAIDFEMLRADAAEADHAKPRKRRKPAA